jgi:uncharacterized phage-associated protein
MSFSVASVANEFVTIARAAGEELSPMKLQKLVYFAHGWYLALTGAPLISEEVQAWQYGPVIPYLYQHFKGYGNGAIEMPMTEDVWENGRWNPKVPLLKDQGPSAEQARSVIRRVWDEYGKYSAARLSNATHQSGSPWEEVYEADRKNAVIPAETIKAYFKGLVNERRG